MMVQTLSEQGAITRLRRRIKELRSTFDGMAEMVHDAYYEHKKGLQIGYSVTKKILEIPTENKALILSNQLHFSCTQVPIHILSSAYTVFYVINHHNTCENTCNFYY